MRRQAPGHYGVDRELLDGDRNPAHRLDADELRRVRDPSSRHATTASRVGGTIGSPSVQPFA
jgi:hypothetical protein